MKTPEEKANAIMDRWEDDIHPDIDASLRLSITEAIALAIAEERKRLLQSFNAVIASRGTPSELERGKILSMVYKFMGALSVGGSLEGNFAEAVCDAVHCLVVDEREGCAKITDEIGGLLAETLAEKIRDRSHRPSGAP